MSVVRQGGFAYSHIIDKGIYWDFPKGTKMNFSLSMKTLALIALVAASTVSIVQIELSASAAVALAQNIH
jgi:hypothetical protein